MRLFELPKGHEGQTIGHKWDSSSPERYLIHDCDPLFTAEFLRTLETAGVWPKLVGRSLDGIGQVGIMPRPPRQH